METVSVQWYDNLSVCLGSETAMETFAEINVAAAAANFSSAVTKAKALKRRKYITLLKLTYLGHCHGSLQW